MGRPKKCPECKENTLDFPIEKELGKCVICQNVDDGLIPQGTWHPDAEHLIIPSKVWAKMSAYCNLAKGEISGFGKIEFNSEPGSATVSDIVIVPQECNAGHTVMKEEYINKFLYYLVKRREDPQDWNLWWHTHGDGGVFWSPTDEQNIQNIQTQFGGMLFSIVINKSSHHLARLDENGETFNLSVVIKPYKKYQKLYNKCRRQVKRLVKEDVVQVIETSRPSSMVQYYRSLL